MSNLVNFHQHLRSVRVAGNSEVKQVAEPVPVPEPQAAEPEAVDIEAIQSVAYEQGVQDAKKALQQEVQAAQALQNRLFKSLAEAESALSASLEAALPELIVEGVRRVVAGWSPTAEEVEGNIQNILAELGPEVGVPELRISAADQAKLDALAGGTWANPSEMRMRVDAKLKEGEYIVSSRFGRVDGRLDSKLSHLRKELQ
jgi:flagellar biosynthesis/type III secretory pathway protein FliH